jgi:hypothetical protein
MKSFYLFLIALFFIVGSINCERHFDEPPEYSGPRVKANISITEIKRLHIPNNFEKINEDLIIEGIVTANDRTDNFYKSIVIQDSTAGITVRLDGFSLFNIYPIGRKIFIRLKGLWLGDYGGMIQLGAGVNRSNPQFPELIPIPQPLFDRVIVKGDLNQNVLPIKLKIQDLNDSLQSMLAS